MEMLEAGLITAIGLIWVLCRFNIRRVAGYAAFVDIGATALLMIIFVGSYGGMMTGIVAGLAVSIFLTLVRKLMGYEQVRLVRKHGEAIAKPRWVRIMEATEKENANG